MSSRPDVYTILARRLKDVLALDDLPAQTARFDRDLHADSLDLVEVIEGVERDLAASGRAVHLPEERLVALATVGDAVRALADLLGEEGR